MTQTSAAGLILKGALSKKILGPSSDWLWIFADAVASDIETVQIAAGVDISEGESSAMASASS